MKSLFKLIHHLIIFIVIITGNDFYDYILGGSIAVIAYIYSFRFVGGFSSSLGYNSTLMSFSHWTIRTFVELLIMFAVRLLYNGLLPIITLINDGNTELIAVMICVLFTFISAEILMNKTGLIKNYF